MKFTATFESAISAELPTATHSYTPVSNHTLIEAVREQCDKRNFAIINERYELGANDSQLFGVFDILTPDGATRKNIGFRNSYNKTLPVGLVAGSTVIVCSNLMFKGNIVMMRKHTNRVGRDLNDMILRALDVVDVEWEEIETTRQQLAAREMPKLEMAQHAGRLFLHDDLLTATQLNVFKRELNESEVFTEPTAWTFYNHITESLKHEHPSTRMQKQVALHHKVLELI